MYLAKSLLYLGVKNPTFDRHKFKALRQSMKLNQAELADVLGTNQYYISHIETGRLQEPSFTFVLKTAKFFNCSVEIFVS